MTNHSRRATLAGLALATMMSPVVALAGMTATAAPAGAAATTRAAAKVNVWQARKEHALNLNRSHRAAYVRRLAGHIRVCRTEDSRNCSWNAHTAGNGRGRSYVDLAGTTFYYNGQVDR